MPPKSDSSSLSSSEIFYTGCRVVVKRRTLYIRSTTHKSVNMATNRMLIVCMLGWLLVGSAVAQKV